MICAEMSPIRKDEKIYAFSSIKEITRLLNCNLFIPASLSNALVRCIYASYIITYIKDKSSLEAYKKSYFQLQGFGNVHDLLIHVSIAKRA